jgi:hypothetical protein
LKEAAESRGGLSIARRGELLSIRNLCLGNTKDILPLDFPLQPLSPVTDVRLESQSKSWTSEPPFLQV